MRTLALQVAVNDRISTLEGVESVTVEYVQPKPYYRVTIVRPGTDVKTLSPIYNAELAVHDLFPNETIDFRVSFDSEIDAEKRMRLQAKASSSGETL